MLKPELKDWEMEGTKEARRVVMMSTAKWKEEMRQDVGFLPTAWLHGIVVGKLVKDWEATERVKRLLGEEALMTTMQEGWSGGFDIGTGEKNYSDNPLYAASSLQGSGGFLLGKGYF